MTSPIQASPDLLSAARTVGALAARHAADADTDRRLRREVVEAVVDAGFPGHFVPTRWGGRAGTFAELTQAVAEVGKGCASAAWIASLSAFAARYGAHLPEEGQSEVWEKGPGTVIVGGLVPSGRAEPTDGGWRLTGKWQYTSGVEFSDWALLNGVVQVGTEQRTWFFAVPRASYEIVDTWFNVGMRATGSNTLVLEDVFVPTCRSFDREEVLSGRGVGSSALCHNIPLRAVHALPFAAPILGAAKGALNSWTTWLAQKKDPTGRSAAEKPANQLVLSRSAGEIDAAELLLSRVIEVADGGAPTTGGIARNARDSSLAVEFLVTAVDRLFSASGTGGQSTTNSLQRSWRDVHSAASHITLQFELAGVDYAKHVLNTN